MTLLVDSLQLGLGLALLLGGGECLVRGAAGLAQRLGVPPLVVGLTVVAFGTSAPEFSVNVTAAVRGNGAVAFGNVVGSNIANVGLILASAAIVRALAIQSVVVVREIPMMLLASAAALIMGFDRLRPELVARYDRADGALLLLFFAVFLYYTVAETLRKRPADPLVQQVREQSVGEGARSLGGSVALVLVGLLGLVIGGQLTVSGAVGLAAAMGVPTALIGLTVVAVGTSLPELSASVMASRKGETDLAIGNVIGSNIFNLLFVLGVTATIRPVPVPAGGNADLAAMIAFAVALLLISGSGKEITRSKGVLLLAAYVGYVSWRAL